MESDIRICKICQKPKTRILVGKFDNKNKRYEDENKKAWRGSVCPECHKEDIKRRMQAMRVLRKSLNDIGE